MKRAILHLVLITFTGVTLLPVVLVVRKAITPGQEFALSINPIPDKVTLQHFRNVLGRTLPDGTWIFGRQLLNSVVISLGTTILGVFLACTAAYAFSRFRFPGQRVGMIAFLVVQMFPATLLIIPMYVILSRMGLLNSALGLILVYATTAIPFCVWMLKGYFDTIPKELEEAALIDGAGRFKIFYVIILPLARPAIAVTALFSFMTAWNEYIMAATFLNKEESYTLPVLLKSYVGQHGSTEWGSFAAGAIIVSIPVVALFYALQKNLVAGLTAGGVKG
jgi:arabinogalactan oligomer / maltooligosaccharide transport system permease protein